MIEKLKITKFGDELEVKINELIDAYNEQDYYLTAALNEAGKRITETEKKIDFIMENTTRNVYKENGIRQYSLKDLYNKD